MKPHIHTQGSDDARNLVAALKAAALAEIGEGCDCEPRVQVHAGRQGRHKGLYVIVGHTNVCDLYRL